MLKDIKGVIFDLDGTLIDSMWVWEKVDLEFIKLKNLNTSSDKIMNDLAHLTFNQAALYFINNFNLKESIEEIQAIWMNIAFEEYKNNVYLKKGAFEFLTYLKKQNIKIALATSSNEKLLYTTLEKNAIKHFFDSILTTNMLGVSKKNPDIYLNSAKIIDIDPKNIAVFEDIPKAMIGAKKAGMRVFAMYDKYSEHQKEDIIKNSNYYLNDFFELIK